jgi:hypothetical protein
MSAFDTAVREALAFELKSIERRLTTLEVTVDVMRAELERIREALETGGKLESVPVGGVKKPLSLNWVRV